MTIKPNWTLPTPSRSETLTAFRTMLSILDDEREIRTALLLAASMSDREYLAGGVAALENVRGAVVAAMIGGRYVS